MGNKRYAIVKVDDGNCPDHFEDITNHFVCENKSLTVQDSLRGINIEKCTLCRYGDTKEQLIKKVAQVLLKQELSLKFFKTSKEKVNAIYEYCLARAKEIVEFLGVE